MGGDLPADKGSLTLNGKRTTKAPFGPIGVMVMACMEEGKCCNTGNPVSGMYIPNWNLARGRPGWQGDGQARNTVDAG